MTIEQDTHIFVVVKATGETKKAKELIIDTRFLYLCDLFCKGYVLPVNVLAITDSSDEAKDIANMEFNQFKFSTYPQPF